MDKLKQLRNQIDKIDESIIKLIAERAMISRQIGLAKKAQNLEVYDREREEFIAKNLHNLCAKYAIDPKMITAIWETILNDSHQNQKKMIGAVDDGQ